MTHINAAPPATRPVAFSIFLPVPAKASPLSSHTPESAVPEEVPHGTRTI
jgi:hypothetical protein